MPTPRPHARLPGACPLSRSAALALLLAACAPESDSTTIEKPDLTTDPAVFDEKAMALTLDAGADGAALDLALPIGNPGARAVSGRYTVTLLDLAGAVIDQITGSFTAPPGGTTLALALDGLPAGTTEADLAKYNLAYRVTWPNDGLARGSRSAFDALQKLSVLIMTEGTIELGRGGHVSLFVLDPATARPIPGATVDLVMTGADGQETSQRVVTDAAGQARGELAPPATDGDVTLRIEVVGAGVTEVEEVPIKIVRSRKVLLTTDKPLYQPGQTVHVRTLALRTGSKLPEADQPIVFEVEDGKGNLLMRERARTDAYGIGHIQVPIASQVNLGTWKIRAKVGGNDDDDTGATISEKTITVDRYVLPKFKVQAALDQTWYRPGATVQVTGEARYFFGKAVAGGAVTITGSTFDVDFTPFTQLQATTDADGRFAATLIVPSSVVGLPLEQGKGLMKIDVTVVDGADHAQTASRTATVAKGAIDVALVPESGRLVPGVENTLFIATTDPMGGPVAARVTLSQDGDELATVETGAAGLGEVTLVPDGKGATTFDVTVTGGGESLTLQRAVAVGSDTETILVRTDKAVYVDGETVTVDVAIADDADRVWLDVVHGGRTVMLEALTVADGRAAFAFDLDGTLTGELIVSVYTMTDRGTLVRDQRLVYVQPNDELRVSLTAQAASYLPGGKAVVDVAVTDTSGRGVPAALGVQVVDEAVFALQESQPGLLKIFFDLARELAAPMISAGCGGCDATSIIVGDEAGTPTYDDKARVTFSALSDSVLHTIEKNTFTATVDAVKKALAPFVAAERERVIDEIADLAQSGIVTWENVGLFLSRADVAGVDFWRQPWGVTTDDAQQLARFVSRGPDERAGTADDLGFEVRYQEAMYRGWGWWGGEGDFADADGGGPWPGAAPNEGEVGAPTDDGQGRDDGGAVKVRQDFPETLFVDPAVITDGEGKARLEIDLADSITTWRMTGLASSLGGLLGSGTGGITVFQDFFADVDFPVAMTRGDVLRVPVALYNYLPTAQTVSVDLEAAPWYEAIGGRSQSVTLQPGEVKAAHFDVRALAVGTHGLTVLARGSTLSDAVRRTVTVRPDGKPILQTASARFAVAPEGAASETVRHVVDVPAANIDGAQGLLVKVYPGYLSQVVEGMDSLLRMPGGCFEQTTSSAWPNVLVTDYLSKTGNLTEALEVKARTYITQGYQRLLTFECASGGFNWWEGDDPGNAVLSAVGIMMFTDTKNVAFVDDGVIDRAAKYLTATQQSDGSWTEERHLHAGNENLGAGSLRATAYITWALQHAGREPATVAKALAHIRAKAGTADDVYTQAMIVLALAAADRGDPAIPSLLDALHAQRIEDGDRVHWSPDDQTMVGGYNDSGDIETTAVVALALMAAEAYPMDVGGAITWLMSMKDDNGNWGYSTQATVLTLKALIASLSAGGDETAATVKVYLDGELAGERAFDDLNADVMWQLDLSDRLGEGAHEVRLEYAGQGNLMWQIASEHWLPWSEVEPEHEGPLAIEVAYDKTQLTTDEVIHVTVTVTNSDPNTTGMMMAELGLPPGFDLDTTALDAILGQGKVARYERTALRLIVYLEPVVAGTPTIFGYDLRAKYPLEATAPESETYLYYDKSVRTGTTPVGLVVQ
ncbi:MAG: hypothetical protein IT385_11770 [Deltaproteobacteria bacterium]|nr:hypothetical protein [Deltaproteobacteria bacterium]